MKQKQRRLLLATNFLHIFGLSMLAPVYALYGLKIGANAWQIGASWGLYNLIAGLVNIMVGRWIDGLRRDKGFIALGYLITVMGISLFLFAHHPAQLYFIQAVNAVGVGLYMPAWKALYSKAGTLGKEASLWGMFDGGNMITMAAAALLAGFLVNQNLYSLMFASIIVLYGLSTLMSLRLK